MLPITNLTELIWDSEKKDALLLTAKSTVGTDYALFRSLCEAFSMMPAHPVRLRAENQLRLLFGIGLPMTAENCDEIWKLTAEYLLLRPFTQKDAEAVKQNGKQTLEPPVFPTPKRLGFSEFPSLPAIQVADYAAWEISQTEWLKRQDRIQGVSLTLPSGFRAVKPSRYHAERHLAKIEPNTNLWASQIFRFSAYAMQKNNQKILLQTACEPSEIAKLLAGTSEKTELPEILWLPEDPTNAEYLIDLCRAYPNPDIWFAARTDEPIDQAWLAARVPLGRVCVFS